MIHSMRRREFITLIGTAAAAWPLAARAQQRERMRRIGWLFSVAEDYPEVQANIAAFLKGLSDRGWVEGRNLRMDYRWYTGEANRLASDAAQLVALDPDVLIASYGAALTQLLNVTRALPIVFVEVNEPVQRGYVSSLARPEGNTTGFTSFEYQIAAKWLERLKQLAPYVSRVAVLGGNFSGIDGRSQLEGVQHAALALGVEVVPLEVRDAAEIVTTLAAFVRGPNDGLIVVQNVTTGLHHQLIVSLAARHKLPAVYFHRHFIAGGGLMSYAPNVAFQYRGAAGYVDRIFRGEKPANLPVQQPIKYELGLNLKTAKALGIEVPPTLLAITDEVIE